MKLNNENNPFELNLLELVSLYWKKKFIIIYSTLFFAIFSVFFSLSLTNIYKSEALLAPLNYQKSLASQISKISSVASYSNFDLPINQGTKSDEAIEIIKSYDFFSKYILTEIKLENLMAAKSWDQRSDELLYDNKIFDDEIWVRKVKFPKTPKPSTQEAFQKYQEILTISQDLKTSFVKISIEHVSPNIAKNWTELIISQVNKSMMETDEIKARNSIEYLKNESEKAKIQSLKLAIANLLESELRVLTLIASSNDYVFKVLDAPIAAEKKFKPNRALICIMITIIGFFLSFIFIFAQFLYHKVKNK